MSDRRFTILATSSLPFERLNEIPEWIDVRVVPFIQISQSINETIKSRITELASKKITAAFTSAHAVKFVAESLTRKVNWKIYCIRSETRNAIIKYFGSELIEKFAPDAMELSRFILADKEKEIVFFCGDQRMDILPDQLSKKGILLEEVRVYETKLSPVFIEENPDAVLFFSPTAVRSFFLANKLSPSTSIFALGKTTAEELKKNTALPIIISPESDKAFVFKMAAEYAASNTPF